MKRIISFILVTILLFLSVVATTVYAEDYSNLSNEELAAKIAELEALLAARNEQQATEQQATEQQGTITITVTINEKERRGSYTGEIVNGKPHGEGTFVSDDSLPALTYKGSWADGAISGAGYIESEAYLVHFDTVDEGKYDRTGTFKGEVYDGLAKGDGYFLTKNKQGTPWSYTGKWANNQFNGYGIQEWHDEDNQIYEGNFKDSGFSPTWGQFISYLGQNHNYYISDKNISYIDKYPHFFNKGGFISSSHINRTFSLSKFKKDQTPYDAKLIEANNLSIIQVFSRNKFGRDYEIVLMEDNEDTIYYGFFDGKTDLDDSMRIKSIYLLPLDWSTYKNVNDQDIWAVFCAFTKSYEVLESVEVTAKAGNVYLRNEDGGAITLIGKGKTISITGFDSEHWLFTAEYNGLSGYLKGTGLSISWDELYNLFN